MKGLRSPLLLGLVFIMFRAGYCKERTEHTDMRDCKTLLNLIMETVNELKKYSSQDVENSVQYLTKKHDYSFDPKGVHNYKSYSEDQRVAGYCKERTEHTDMRDCKTLLNLIMETVNELKKYSSQDVENSVQYLTKKHDYSFDPKGVHNYKSYSEDQRVGPLHFSPKCTKHFHRIYHNTRDCTIPAWCTVISRNPKKSRKSASETNRETKELKTFIS
ncbi:UNVERIFIED_CONTAM: hypothetical protein FKN15_065369 [Acipenser sinensis]